MSYRWITENHNAQQALSFNQASFSPLPSPKFLHGNLESLEKALNSKSVSTVSVQELISKSTTEELQEFLIQHLEIEGVFGEQEVKDYIKATVAQLSRAQLEHYSTNRTILKVKKLRNGALVTVSIELYPINPIGSNVAMITSKGVILANAKHQQPEARLAEFILKKHGLNVVRKLSDPFRLSGADYIALGKQLTFIGVGLQTSDETVRYLLSKNVFDSERVAVVKDFFDRSLDRKNLSSIFRVISKGTALVLDLVMGGNNLNRRLVTEYVRTESGYSVSKLDVEFGEYLQTLGFHLIRVPERKNLALLNLGSGTLLVGSAEIASLISMDQKFDGSGVSVIDFQGIDPSEQGFNDILLLRTTTPDSIIELAEKTPLPLPSYWISSKEKTPHQTTNTILMIAPIKFGHNPETAQDNYFMHEVEQQETVVEKKALMEFSALHREFTNAGIQVVLICPEISHESPDAVFCNNWFSTHPISEQKESTVVFYPMKTPSRRAERRQHIVTMFQDIYQREISFVHWENCDRPKFLESTGVVVMDRTRKIVYATLSQRCSSQIAKKWAEKLGFEVCLFRSIDDQGRPIYHTNVLMSVGTSLAIICKEAIVKEDRDRVITKLSKTHTIVDITFEQMNHFCGNVLEVKGAENKKLLCMSSKAFHSFTEEQKTIILQHVDKIIHTDVDIIETVGGGGVRCMMGELF